MRTKVRGFRPAQFFYKQEWFNLDINIEVYFFLELINEKVAAYLKRLKIRDLYDILFLLRHVKNRAEVKPRIEALVRNFKPPTDKEELKVLIFEGIAPDAKQILDYIKRWI